MDEDNFRIAKPSSTARMVREDIEDFVTALKTAYPSVVFFSERDIAGDNPQVYPDPYAWFNAKPRLDYCAMFRVPTDEELADGRPEILANSKGRPFLGHTRSALRKSGRTGHINFVGVPYMSEAIQSAVESDDYRRYKAHPEQLENIRAFNDSDRNSAKISFYFDREDSEVSTFAATVMKLWRNLLVSTIANIDLVSGQVVSTASLGPLGTSRRIMDACAAAEGLYRSVHYYPKLGRYIGNGPTEAYRKKVRKRLGLH
jgi:hypothetical protein